MNNEGERKKVESTKNVKWAKTEVGKEKWNMKAFARFLLKFMVSPHNGMKQL